MNEKYLIVDSKILPEYFEKVINAREMLKNEICSNISEACKMVGISRSTYYKYKDLVFMPREKNIGKKALISLMIYDMRGVLSKTIDLISNYEYNIITINQNIPINGIATVMISLDMSHATIEANELIKKLDEMENVSSAKLVALE